MSSSVGKILKVQYFPLSGKPSFEIFCQVIFLHIKPFTTNPYEVFQVGCRCTSHWILRVSFLKVIQPFKKSQFPAILGNVLQNLKVISHSTRARQNRKAMNPEFCAWNSLLTFFSAATAAFSFTLTALLAGGMYYFNIVNGWRFWLLTCSCDNVIIITLSL